MAQISKLYKFYLKKIFKKNWLRIIFIAVATAIVWFVIPYFGARLLLNMGRESITQDEQVSKDQKDEALKNINNVTFRNANAFLLEDLSAWRKSLRDKM